MKNLFTLSLLILCIGLGTCTEQNPTVGNQDDPTPIEFFLQFENPENETDLFESDKYDTDSLHLWYFFKDGTKSGPFLSPITKVNGYTTVGPVHLVRLTGGLGEMRDRSKETVFESFSKLYFSNGDVDTIYSIVNCHSSCKFQDKTMQLYYNDKLIFDFDFRNKDSELLRNLILNNKYPFKDTVIFTIEKRPEF